MEALAEAKEAAENQRLEDEEERHCEEEWAEAEKERAAVVARGEGVTWRQMAGVTGVVIAAMGTLVRTVDRKVCFPPPSFDAAGRSH